MVNKKVFWFAVTAFLLFINVTTALAQESSELQWLWGEVVSVNLQNNEILVRYPDYETDKDKEMTITVNEKTTFENSASLIDIKPQDKLSIDYRVSPDGKNIAENVSVEKAEGEVPLQQENIPQEEAPIGEGAGVPSY
jgi:hypothetical protein